MFYRRPQISRASTQSFWSELESISFEKEASYSAIAARFLNKGGFTNAAKAVADYGDRAENLILKGLLTEGPGPRILPTRTVSGLANTVAENPHVGLVALGSPIPGSTEAALAGTAVANRLLLPGGKPPTAARQAILDEFASRDVRKAPWVPYMERGGEWAHNKLQGMKSRLFGPKGGGSQ